MPRGMNVVAAATGLLVSAIVTLVVANAFLFDRIFPLEK